MSRRKRVLAALIAAVSCGSMPAIGEVAVGPSGPYVSTILMAIIEDPDPINGHSWQPIRDVDPQLVLNPEGFLRGDGRPEIVHMPGTGRPLVMWAYKSGSNHNIAFSEWDGTHWREPLFLTQGASDELDPRLHLAPDGSIVAVWWRDDLQGSIFATRRPAGSSLWLAENEVTELFESGMRPSVTIHDGVLSVAYERILFDKRQIVLAVEDTPGHFTKEVLGHVQCSGGAGLSTCGAQFDVILHSQGGRLWIDWKSSPTELAYRVLQPEGWSTTSYVTVPDSSWVEIELGRRWIRSEVVAP